MCLSRPTLGRRLTMGSHTTKLLAKHATNILGEFRVKLDKSVHFVNAAPVKLPMTKLMDNVVWRSCFAHTMQLVVNGDSL